MTSSILIVDDAPATIHLVSGILESYHLLFALDGVQALEIIKEQPAIDLILLDIEMPRLNGYQVIETLKTNPKTKDIPIIFLTVKDHEAEEVRGLSLGAVDYIKKPINSAILKKRVETHISLRKAQLFIEQQNDILESKVRQRTREILITRDITVQSMMSLLEVRHLESGRHISRTQTLVRMLCDYLATNGPYTEIITKDLVENIYRTAPLHDIGKIGVPDSILLKPGKLDDNEYDMMKMHVTYAEQAFSNVDERLGNTNFLNVAREIASSHHERWDGTGYPKGLKGSEIPLSGRVMALADVYDALVSKRIYKEAFTHEKAKEIIVQERGRHFDPAIVDAFLALETEFIAIGRLSDKGDGS